MNEVLALLLGALVALGIAGLVRAWLMLRQSPPPLTPPDPDPRLAAWLAFVLTPFIAALLMWLSTLVADL